MWERGLKYCELVVYPDEPWSLPLWERGLKFGGAWTENHRDSSVAPLVGAWIEIKFTASTNATMASLPLWERGLKLRVVLLSVLRIQVGDMLDECVERFPF